MALSVMFACVNRVNFLFRFEPKLAEIFKDIHDAYEKIDARLRAEQFKVSNAGWSLSQMYYGLEEQ